MRENGEPAATVNLQVEAFITKSGGKICSSLADLVQALGEVER